MDDVLVTIRMPSPLVKRLNALCEKNFYMDLSEQIRDVLNKKFLEHENQKSNAIKKSSNKKELAYMLERNEQLLRELKESLRNLK